MCASCLILVLLLLQLLLQLLLLPYLYPSFLARRLGREMSHTHYCPGRKGSSLISLVDLPTEFVHCPRQLIRSPLHSLARLTSTHLSRGRAE